MQKRLLVDLNDIQAFRIVCQEKPCGASVFVNIGNTPMTGLVQCPSCKTTYYPNGESLVSESEVAVIYHINQILNRENSLRPNVQLELEINSDE